MMSTEALMLTIVFLLLVTCSLVGYGVYLVRESVQIQRRVARRWLLLHPPPITHPQEEGTAQQAVASRPGYLGQRPKPPQPNSVGDQQS
jgi:hypothetical protein